MKKDVRKCCKIGVMQKTAYLVLYFVKFLSHPAKGMLKKLSLHLKRKSTIFCLKPYFTTLSVKPFEKLTAIMKKLLSAKGCPWDKEQTHRTLLKHMYEEADEVADAVKAEDWQNLKEELGDLLLQIVFHSELAAKKGRFDINDVVEGINSKLIRRHPHVFGRSNAKTSKEVLTQWEHIKQKEKLSKRKK